jgi:hypothetical protein
MDASTVPSPRRGENREESDGSRQTGHKVPSCGRLARHPLAILLTAAEVNETTMLEATTDAIQPIKGSSGRLASGPDKLYADKGYASKEQGYAS